MSKKRVDAVLDYWFNGIDDSTPIDTKKIPFKKWFLKDETIDSQIRELFESDLLKAADGQYKDWEETNEGRLALIILFDQFPRNMYRDKEMMFTFDAIALELTLRTIEQGKDRELMLIQRAFFYLPLMHFEDLKIQQKSVEFFELLVGESKVKNASNTHYFENSLNYAKEHHKDIAQFGRFPYRDAILKRTVQ